MTKQVDNGELYLSRYCGSMTKGDPLRVEIRRAWPEDKPLWPRPRPEDEPPVADVTWQEFKEILRLGQQLLEED